MSRATVDLPDVVRSVVDAHRHERGPLLVVLQEIQERLGCLDPEVVPLVAAEMNLSRADVHGVATFYRDFHSEPHGRALIRICRSEACKSMGAEDLVVQVETALGVKTGETSPDGSVTLDQVFCLGNCALSPAAQINGRLHGRLTPDRVLDIARRDAS